MRRLTLLTVLLAIPAFADEKAKPNTLTPKEIAEGWVLMFDGETTFGLKLEGDWKLGGGVIELGGPKEASLAFTTFLGAVMVSLDYSPDGTEWGHTNIVRHASGFHATSGTSRDAKGREVPMTFQYPFHDQPTLRVPAGKRALFRTIRAKLLEPTPLFNGKDLTGWVEFRPTKDKKVASTFSVTKEGWLNVKNGPGDLQTKGQWADFVLQLECISNGKHLNSGLFFRCIPDLYQQGYEAQIRNEWMGDDRTKPVDYGTGAIYRRQAARKVVSTDGEWFTMTVAAHGRHIATWVNGYQVADWTDDRKESDNARTGFKKGKGALSIQGHDPTTDLSFRNIRIQSLDAK